MLSAGRCPRARRLCPARRAPRLPPSVPCAGPAPPAPSSIRRPRSGPKGRAAGLCRPARRPTRRPRRSPAPLRTRALRTACPGRRRQVPPLAPRGIDHQVGACRKLEALLKGARKRRVGAGRQRVVQAKGEIFHRIVVRPVMARPRPPYVVQRQVFGLCDPPSPPSTRAR